MEAMTLRAAAQELADTATAFGEAATSVCFRQE